MTEAVVHVVPRDTDIPEEVHNIVDHLRMFGRNNRDVLIVLGGIVVSQYVCRAMFRRELTRLQFNVEVFPFDHLTSTDFVYDD